jgi:L-ascorbate metabolism protein UlaG (beta-lactamase superfamily)
MPIITSLLTRSRRVATTLACALTLAALPACASLGKAAYHGPPSDHFDGEYFHNYNRVRDHQIADAVRRAASEIRGNRGHWVEWENVPTDVPPPRVGMGDLRVTFVNHATVLIQMDSLNILTDPIWSKRASPVSWLGPKRHRPPGIRFEDLPPIDVVLISHDHYDHMDLPTLRRLARTFHPRIVTGLGNARYLARHGVPGAEDIDWWQTLSVKPGVRVIGVPAQHWSARSLTDQWRTLWLGFVIEGPSGRVYFAGDTGFAEFLRMIHDRFGTFRLVLLPIAPARPRKVLAARHLSADDAVRAVEVLGAPSAMAIHFGSFRQGQDSESEPVETLRRAVERASPARVHFWALRNGEARWVPPVD